jgi:hypothetical protein
LDLARYHQPPTEDNDTIKAALNTRITEGQKMIDAKVASPEQM